MGQSALIGLIFLFFLFLFIYLQTRDKEWTERDMRHGGEWKLKRKDGKLNVTYTDNDPPYYPQEDEFNDEDDEDIDNRGPIPKKII
jgi:hypothetical protein